MRSGRASSIPANEQLSLSFTDCIEPAQAQTEATLREQLERSSGRAVKLTLTDNATSLLSVRERGSLLGVRLHRMFLDAGEDVIAELGGYIRTRKGKTPKFWEFVRTNRSHITRPPKRRPRIVHKGRFHDLSESFNRVNAGYFEGRLKCAITWGTMLKARARGRTLGTYCQATDLIRIHPSLDRRGVPVYYLDFVVYHEMLHAWLMQEEAGGSQQSGRRRELHGARFKALERKYRDYARAMAWERG